MTTYATYFDKNYLDRGLALISSVREFDKESKIFVLAFDETVAKEVADRFLDVKILSEQDLIDFEPRLGQTKKVRSRIEQYFTQTPVLMRRVMQETTIGEVCVYLDADLYFFKTPDLVIKDMNDHSVGIIAHKFSRKMERRLSKFGKYNVGWVGIRNDQNGQDCVQWWSESCLDWCFDKAEDGKFADQGYLNEFPSRFNSVKVLENPGFNLAPWNVGNYHLSLKDSNLHVDDLHPLVFYHFHGLSRGFGRYFTGEIIYRTRLNKQLKKFAYQKYIGNLESLVSTFPDTGKSSKSSARGKGIKVHMLKLRKSLFRSISFLIGNTIKAK